MPQDKYYGVNVTLSDPANEARVVVPGTPLTEPSRSLYVGVGGDIVMRGMDDTTNKTWKNVPDGAILPFRASLIVASGTTATNILALY